MPFNEGYYLKIACQTEPSGLHVISPIYLKIIPQQFIEGLLKLDLVLGLKKSKTE